VQVIWRHAEFVQQIIAPGSALDDLVCQNLSDFPFEKLAATPGIDGDEVSAWRLETVLSPAHYNALRG